ncbi:MAG TPA: ABC transporter permease [Acidimicrobiales bacterium]|jgi:branched-chain amino acid transport system permease protein|nr:ABC transporter permease [Acidimicrobiales bacterium]
MSEFLTFLIIGVVSASIYAVTAMGLVVTYNTTGVFNFAQGAVGMVLAFSFWQLWQGWGLPLLIALGLVLFVLAPVLGALVERTMMRNLHTAATGIPLVVTIGLLLLLVGVANSAWNQGTARTLPAFLPNVEVNLGQVNVSGEQLITIGLAVVVAVALRLFYRRTRTGVAMRAVVDDPELAALNGARSGRLASYSWMIGTMLAGVAGILLAPQTSMNILDLTVLVVYGYSAAVVGRLKSLPLTVLGALILGIANSMAIGYAPSSAVSIITAALPMGLLFLTLIILPQARLTVGRIVRERPLAVASLQKSMVGAGVLVLASIGLALALNGSNLITFGDLLVFAILGLSLVPLSGYAGQISLCQFTFLGLGSVVMAKVGGGHSVLGVLAAIGACAVAGALLSLPALRLRGLYLALATLAFAVLMDNLFFTATSIMGTNGTLPVGRPDIFGFFSGNRAFTILVAVVLGIGIVGIGSLRRSTFGRRLVGMNDSPAACATAGLNLTVTKLVVFSVSAGLAGLAGALYGGVEQSIDAGQFQFLLSLAFFLTVTLCGISSLSGPVIAAIFVSVIPVVAGHVSSVPDLLYLGAGVGAISIGRSPNGVAGSIAKLSARWRPSNKPAPAGRSPVVAPRELVSDVGMKSVG